MASAGVTGAFSGLANFVNNSGMDFLKLYLQQEDKRKRESQRKNWANELDVIQSAKKDANKQEKAILNEVEKQPDVAKQVVKGALTSAPLPTPSPQSSPSLQSGAAVATPSRDVVSTKMSAMQSGPARTPYSDVAEAGILNVLQSGPRTADVSRERAQLSKLENLYGQMSIMGASPTETAAVRDKITQLRTQIAGATTDPNEEARNKLLDTYMSNDLKSKLQLELQRMKERGMTKRKGMDIKAKGKSKAIDELKTVRDYVKDRVKTLKKNISKGMTDITKRQKDDPELFPAMMPQYFTATQDSATIPAGMTAEGEEIPEKKIPVYETRDQAEIFKGEADELEVLEPILNQLMLLSAEADNLSTDTIKQIVSELKEQPAFMTQNERREFYMKKAGGQEDNRYSNPDAGIKWK